MPILRDLENLAHDLIDAHDAITKANKEAASVELTAKTVKESDAPPEVKVAWAILAEVAARKIPQTLIAYERTKEEFAVGREEWARAQREAAGG